MSIFRSSKKINKRENQKSQLNEAAMVSGGEKVGVFLSTKPVLKRPFLSEKAHALNQYNKHVFFVNVSVNKPAIKKEIERRYGVRVATINVLRGGGKSKRFRNKIGRTSLFKKAVVTLKSGHKIEIGV